LFRKSRKSAPVERWFYRSDRVNSIVGDETVVEATAPVGGFEPPTKGLTDLCTTVVLHRNVTPRASILSVTEVAERDLYLRGQTP
jgi:hypothetical protein